MKILAFAASNSKKSINQQLVTYAAGLIKQNTVTDVEIQFIDLNDFEMPIYSIDRENEEGIPDEAKRFYEVIGSADALLISFAEYNGTYTAAYKNIFDWVSRIDVQLYQNKPVIALSASPGGRGAAGVLGVFVSSAKRFGANVVSHMSIGPFGEVFDFEKGELSDMAMREDLKLNLEALKSI